MIAAQTTATTQPKPPPAANAEYIHRAAWKAGMLASINVLALVLAARFILLVAVVGALLLAWTVLKSPDPVAIPALVVLGVYCALIVIPVVWLSSRR